MGSSGATKVTITINQENFSFISRWVFDICTKTHQTDKVLVNIDLTTNCSFNVRIA